MNNHESVADAYVALLASRGIKHLFGNAGTDFPPIIEALARAKAEGRPHPLPLTIPHENIAVAMAHGWHMVTGKVPAVMVHVGLGTANALNGIVNAARQNVPILFTAGRTPLFEEGLPGARNNYIHWAQECFDQAGIVREFVKWDYELRHAIQLETVVDRALALAATAPRGPVYLTLPREVLAMPAAGKASTQARILAASVPQPDHGAVLAAAKLLRDARRPLIVTANAGRDAQAVSALVRLAEHGSIPVVEYRPRYLNLPHAHPLHAGWDPHPLLPKADLVLVVDCDVPWLPVQATASCPVIQVGLDPLCARYPIRGFPADIAITGDVAATLAALVAEIPGRREPWYRKPAARSIEANGAVITPALVSRALAELVDESTILVNEYPLVLEEMSLATPGSYFAHSPAGGLGWALGAAMGAKMGAPEKTVIATVGDGAYMFGNPTPAHYVARALNIPTLTVIFNNGMWAAVHRSTLSMYPDGYAARSDEPPFATLRPSPDYARVAEGSGAWAVRVTEPGQLKAALRRALDEVRGGRPAVLDVAVAPVFNRTS
jgi:acetolactate synthase I/II/III large subunit